MTLVKKAISIFLTLVLLTGQVGLSLGTHFCGGEAVLSKLTIGEAHLDCGMEEMAPCESNPKNEDQLANEPCCQDHFLSLDIDEDFNPGKKLSVDNLQLAAVAVVLFFDWTQFFPLSNKTYFADYPPPPLERDIPVLFQTFLL